MDARACKNGIPLSQSPTCCRREDKRSWNALDHHAHCAAFAPIDWEHLACRRSEREDLAMIQESDWDQGRALPVTERHAWILHCTALHCTALHCTVLQFHRSPGVTSAPHENFAVAEAVLKRAFLLGEPGGLRRGWRTLLLLGDSFCSGLDPSASAPPLRRNSLIDISRTLLGVDWSSSYFRLAGVAGGGAVRLP